ncbi:hypothetical protein C0081_21375 [Cohaesibacter celericrescens]|uniref:Uncharacterized protein n=1 Tax=Cohaesibacter celericrescens TaxID=2067669 RepID=A0A2N5XKA1_9HYPH|nr:hypothetical protein C0081_21375 [Cohaesibacter celericrescens]
MKSLIRQTLKTIEPPHEDQSYGGSIVVIDPIKPDGYEGEAVGQPRFGEEFGPDEIFSVDLKAPSDFSVGFLCLLAVAVKDNIAHQH